MSIEYVRNTYGVPARKGGRVRTRAGLLGTITSATHYVMVRLDGRRGVMPYHPTELDYLVPGDDTDSSRWVDAEALRRVVLHVAGVPDARR